MLRGNRLAWSVSRTCSTRNFCSSTRSVRKLRVDNPSTLETYVEVDLADSDEASRMVKKAVEAQLDWKSTTLAERIELCSRWLADMQKDVDRIAMDISNSMGKPLKQARGEMGGMAERVLAMIDMAPTALADEVLPEERKGGERRIQKVPVGVVFTIAPWNYPLLCAVNSVVPAVLAGNSIILKHSSRTPLVANAFADSFSRAGAPAGLVQAISCSHSIVEEVIKNPGVGFVNFTGSVPGGYSIQGAVSKRVDIDATLELGGKDPAYVCEDADMDSAVATVVDGALYNAGQCCCAMERAYVHASRYDEFLEKAKAVFEEQILGDPMNPSTTMGPLAQPNASDFLRNQVEDARNKGAKLLTGGKPTTVNGKGRYFEPTLLSGCDHTMDIVMEESFGPVLPVIKVDSDEEAVNLMNDSPFGLTAAIFTKSMDRAKRIGTDIRTGTVFMNRCDRVDPYLPWTGQNQTGKGVSLSRHGFAGVTKLKSYNFNP